MSTYYREAYLDAKIVSASPLQLVHLAYEGAIEAVHNARQHLREQRITQRSRAITTAQEIIVELTQALDYERGKDLSVRLARLYGYMLNRLREANFHQIEAPLAEVQGLLETIGESWRELARTETTAVDSIPPGTGAWVERPAAVYSY